MAAINGITINGLSFDISDKKQLTSTARASAYADALAKAKDYASFAGLTLGNAVTITDAAVASPPPRPFPVFGAQAAFAKSDQTTTVTVGNVDVSYDLSVVFAFN